MASGTRKCQACGTDIREAVNGDWLDGAGYWQCSDESPATRAQVALTGARPAHEPATKTFKVMYVVIVDAYTESGAIEEANQLIADDSFEPYHVTEMDDSPADESFPDTSGTCS